MFKSYLIPFLLSFSLSIFITPIVRRIAIINGCIAKPREDRWNKNPTALFGGVAIFLSFIIPYAIFVRFSMENIGIILAGCFIFGAGMFDDIVHIKPYTKLLTQIVAAALLLNFGIKINAIPYPLISAPFTILWIVAIINSFNLLDNMDGLSGGIAAIVGVVLFLFSILNGNFEVGLPAIILTGSLLGFLRYNYPPAKVYMGDTGSLVSGFLLAMAAINISYASMDRKVVLLTPILIMSLPIYDTIFLMIMRIKKKKHIFNKTRDHFALRLVIMGYSVKKSIWIMYLFSIALAFLAMIVVFSNNLTGLIAIAIIALIFILMAKRVGMVNIDD